MPITRLLANNRLPLDQQHVVQIAFNYALSKLHLADRNDPICAIVAQRILEVHQRGVTDAVALAEITVREIRLQ